MATWNDFCSVAGMSRQNLIRTAEFPYHVTGRTNNKEWFSVTMQECWTIFGRVLEEVSQKFGAKIATFVLMSNHFHMILWTPNENLDQIMNYLMSKTSRLINQTVGRVNHVFGARYKWCLIETSEYLTHAYRYNYQNPLRVGLTKKVEDYPYSTLFYLCRNQDLKFPIHDNELIQLTSIDPCVRSRIVWLNDAYNSKQIEVLRKAMRRTTFQFPKHKQYKSIVNSLNRTKGSKR